MAGHWESVVEKGSDPGIAPSHWGVVKVLNFRSNDIFICLNLPISPLKFD